MITASKLNGQRPESVPVPADIKDFLNRLSENYTNHDIAGIMSAISDSFLHQVLNKREFESFLRRSYIFRHLSHLKITILTIDVKENYAELAGYGESDLGVIPASDPFLPLIGGTKLIMEKNEWKLSGNQSRYSLGLYLVFHQLSAYFFPSDILLYRLLLPKAFNIPAKPEVFVKITDFEQTRMPLPPYLVAHVQILAEYKGLQGWYTLTMPETEWAPVEMGKTIGYPKYVADSILFERTKEGWKAEVSNRGEIDLSLSLNYAEDKNQANWFEQITRNHPFSVMRKLIPPFKEKPWFLMMPSKNTGTSDEFLILKGDPMISGIPKVYEDFGKVMITLKTNQPWGNLFPKELMTKGIFMNFAGGLTLRHTFREVIKQD
jgi:hypothetical protein